MLKAGLTGGIGSGKSTIAMVFQALGIPVFDADSEAKKIMNEDPALKKNIIALFGENAYENNLLNRKFIAEIVFNDPEKIEQLNAAVHPVTIAASDKWMREQTTGYVIKEAALLFETAAAAQLDYIIGVNAPLHIRIQRVMKRDGLTRDSVLARMKKQIDEDIKMRLCDFVIINDELALVLPQVLALHEKLKTLSQSDKKFAL